MTEMVAVSAESRRAVADWIGERPETVLAVHALRAGLGRLWIAGTAEDPAAVLVESPLVPGEPQAFGEPRLALDLLETARGWRCVEVERTVADQFREALDRRGQRAEVVIDVVHVLEDEPPVRPHPLVRTITPADLAHLHPAEPDLLPDASLAEPAAASGRLAAAVDGERIVGHGSSFAAGDHHADVGVHVAGSHRNQGIATAAAAATCRALLAAGLTPVWGAGAHNAPSLRIAAKLGFVEVARLVYLVPAASTSDSDR